SRRGRLLGPEPRARRTPGWGSCLRTTRWRNARGSRGPGPSFQPAIGRPAAEMIPSLRRPRWARSRLALEFVRFGDRREPVGEPRGTAGLVAARWTTVELRRAVEVFPHHTHVRGVTPGERRDRQRLARVGMELLRHHPRGQCTSGGPFDQLEAPREVLDGVGAQQAITRQPQRADEPRIAGHALRVLPLDLVVGVVLIARQAADVGVDPQTLFDLM